MEVIHPQAPSWDLFLSMLLRHAPAAACSATDSQLWTKSACSGVVGKCSTFKAKSHLCTFLHVPRPLPTLTRAPAPTLRLTRSCAPKMHRVVVWVLRLEGSFLDPVPSWFIPCPFLTLTLPLSLYTPHLTRSCGLRTHTPVLWECSTFKAPPGTETSASLRSMTRRPSRFPRR